MLELTQSLLRETHMYRQAVMMEQERMNQDQFFSRLGNLPVVTSAWVQACDLYMKTKDRNAIFRTTCNLAEGGVKKLAETTKPLVDKYQPQLNLVNSFACQQLAKLEENYPVITKPTSQVLDEGKKVCETVLKPVTDRVNAVRETYSKGKEQVCKVTQLGTNTVTTIKDFGVAQVSRSMETPCGKFVMEKVNHALDFSEQCVEKYLPDSEEDGEDEEEDDNQKERSSENPLTKVASLSTKVRHRMYKRAMKDFKGLQMRSQETLSKLNFTVNLIQYAKANMESTKGKISETYDQVQEKLGNVWEQINREESDGEEHAPQTLEGQTVAVARRLTKVLKTNVAKVTGYLPESMQPAALKDMLNQAKQFSSDLYKSFKNASSFGDIPSWVLQQTKEKLNYLQETLSYLSDMLAQSSLNWMAVDMPDMEDILFEEPLDARPSNGHAHQV
ncbi:hypothetical protein CHS0354_004389 [Potamilus streckersoni]|uniref:Perilipin n=1 Tax=Potamilus streckersoni TaxID=2493646 RepID=A0AAE0T0K2_9BIVA|nr:hypothetical protein CHS0354_004389 [Potamilus streckersoni]